MLLIRAYNRNTKELDVKVRYVDDERSNIVENEKIYLHFCGGSIKKIVELENKFNENEYVEYIKPIEPNDNLRKHICVFTTNYILTFI